MEIQRATISCLPLAWNGKDETPWILSTRQTFYPFRKLSHKTNQYISLFSMEKSPTPLEASKLTISHSTLLVWGLCLRLFEHNGCWLGAVPRHSLPPSLPRAPAAFGLEDTTPVFCQLLQLEDSMQWNWFSQELHSCKRGKELILLWGSKSLFPSYWRVCVYLPGCSLLCKKNINAPSSYPCTKAPPMSEPPLSQVPTLGWSLFPWHFSFSESAK